MNLPTQIAQSDYMHWAKTQQAAQYNLANSGLAAFPLRELPVALDELELSGASFYGWPPLQQALAAFLNVPEPNVVHAIGTSGANHLAMAALLNPGDEVLIEQPTYELLLSTAGFFRTHIRRLPRLFEQGYALDLNRFADSLSPKTRLIILTNLHNPSSAFIPDDTLREAARLAARHGAWILVDEVYLDARFPPHRRTAFGLAENIIVTSSLTKVYGLSGIRCGWCLAPAPLAEKMWRLNDLFGVIPAHAAERLSVAVFKHFPLVAQRAQRILNPNRDLLNTFLAQRDDLDSSPLDHGTVVFPRLKSGRVDDLCRLLRAEYQTTVVPGHFFDSPSHIRIGIGRETPETSEGLQRLAAALDRMR